MKEFNKLQLEILKDGFMIGASIALAILCFSAIL
jgi:hypothetical protein